MDTDQIRDYAVDRRKDSNSTAANAADAVADLRDAYNLIANAWSHLGGNTYVAEFYDVSRKSLEAMLAKLVGNIGAIVLAADLPDEMRL